MRALLAATFAVVALSGTVSAKTVSPTPGDPFPASWLSASAPCSDDLFCGQIPAADSVAFFADGEWDPVSGNCGFVSTTETIVITNSLCGIVSFCTLTGAPFGSAIGSVPRAFAFGLSGDMWVGTWNVAGTEPEQLVHVNASCQTIASFIIDDPGTALNYQFTGLALDRANNHLWGLTRNNPAGTVSRFVEFDIASGTPVLVQGPHPVPWNGGNNAVGSAGLEYNNRDCTIVALRRDANNVGVTETTVFKDNGAAAPTLIAFCNIPNTPCTGAGNGTNSPWGIALVEDPNIGDYLIFNDLNIDAGCAGQFGVPLDLHVSTLPTYTNTCDVVAVEPSTWGQIKNNYSR